MPELAIGPGETLYYEYHAPRGDARTLLFVNALTGSTATWEHPEIGPALRTQGFGTLAWNFRGQASTRYSAHTALTPQLTVQDLLRLMKRVAPPRPVLVGLSIGGLYGAQAQLAGAGAEALVLVNTLRKPGLRLEWINRAVETLARLGGSRLVMEANLPMLVNPEQLAAMRPTVFGAQRYAPMDPHEGLYRLLERSVEADWNVAWERLSVPVLVMTGLHDRVFHVAEDVAELMARMPSAREVRFADAGHLIPMERPAAFAQALAEFASS